MPTRFVFSSKAKDDLPGRGFDEILDTSIDSRDAYTLLETYKDWRKTLSNSYESKFLVGNKLYNSVEHFLRVSKFMVKSTDYANTFSINSGSKWSLDPKLSKIAGKTGKFYTTKFDWIAITIAQYSKFSQNPHLRDILIATVNAELYVHNIAKNRLIRWPILERVRKCIQNYPPQTNLFPTSPHVIYCNVATVICPLTDFTQFIVGTKLVTIIGEEHDISKENSENEFSVSVTKYVTSTIHRNLNSVVLLEISPNICDQDLKTIGSLPIREISSALGSDNLQLIRSDFRGLLLGRTNQKILYCQDMLVQNVKSGNWVPLSIEDVIKYFIWNGESLSIVREKFIMDKILTSGDLDIMSENILDRLDKDTLELFKNIKENLQTHSQFDHLHFQPFGKPYGERETSFSHETWMSDVVIPLKTAWAMITDYFIMYNILVQSHINEMIVIAGYKHSENIVRRLSIFSSDDIIKIQSKASVDSCAHLAFGVVTVSDDVCKDIKLNNME
jgi:predicted NAD-dependent protein-ADP-ribosyltransferase YbiA (DUF1768 family)